MDEILWFRLAGSALGLFGRDELAADAAVASAGSGFEGRVGRLLGIFRRTQGHLWELAYNPSFPTVDGVVRI